MAELNKSYAHPVTQESGLLSSTESAYPLNANRHAECPDCHNAHAARAWTPAATAPAVSPPLTGASGVDASGQGARHPAVSEYEVCVKCHGSSSNKPQGPGYSAYGYTASRQTDAVAGTSFDTLLEFSSAVARHNVMLPRRLPGSAVPSLRASMLTLGGSATGRSLAVGTHIYCGDCHNSDETRSAGGSRAAGVHGSNWPHILERRYAMEPPPAAPGGSTAGVAYQSGVAGTAAICVKCHDVDGSILQDRSFGEHQKHVSGERTACATCHDSHGIEGGTAANNRSLLNFDTAIVGPSSSGILRFESTGTFSGRCYLRCHGTNHNPESY
jgi:nitrate/TMAO reductase-like tetraheme cytochrome c subunit